MIELNVDSNDVRRRVLLVVSWVLRITVLGTVAGIAWHMLKAYSPINSLLYVEWETLSHDAGRAVDRITAIVLVSLAMFALGHPIRVVTGLIGGVILAWAIATTLIGSGMSWKPAEWNWFEVVAVPAQATRWLAPFVLGMLYARMRRDGGAARTTDLAWLLRIGAAATFAAHGMEAIWQHPTFKDYLIVAAESFFGAQLPERLAGQMLYVIGGIDLLLALLVLLTRWRWVVIYMAAWGAITAGARIVHAGFDAWPEFVIRFAHWGVPLALLILWWRLPTMVSPAGAGERAAVSVRPQEVV